MFTNLNGRLCNAGERTVKSVFSSQVANIVVIRMVVAGECIECALSVKENTKKRHESLPELYGDD